MQEAGAANPPQQEPARTLWNLGKGFDAVASWLEGLVDLILLCISTSDILKLCSFRTAF